MTTIRRFDPFREMQRLNQLMPIPFPAPFRPAAGWGSPFAPAGEPAATAWGIPMDVRRSAGRLTVTASLPGFTPDEVDVTITPDRILTVKAARQAETARQTETEQPAGEYLLRERRYGNYQRALRLPADLDLDAAAVTLEHGILTVTIPAAEAAQTRKLPIANNPAVDADAAPAAA